MNRCSVRLIALACIVVAPAALFAEERRSLAENDFSTDPQWEGHYNRLLPDPLPAGRQDFGFSDTHFAGGKQEGEIGGRVQRSPILSSYAKVIKPKSLDDRLSASGKFAVTADEGGTGALFGWFNADESRGWRTNNSLVLRFDGNKEKYWVYFEYGTRHWLADGKGCFEGERWQTTPSKPFAADGTPHTWSMDYDPAGDNGNGLITFILDSEIYKLPLKPGHKADGATFNRFGMFNQMISGGVMEAYFDDLVLDGEPIKSLQPDDGWESRRNRGEFKHRFVSGMHDFGYSPDTSHAGGKKGEIGGVIWRGAEPPAYYADPVGPFSLGAHAFEAEGTVALRAAGSDSGVYIGWFNAGSRRAKKREESDEPAAHILGIFLEGPSRVGHYFRPAYRTATGQGGPAESAPLIRPDRQVHRWKMRYDPQGAEGRGRITVVFNGKEQVLDLAAGHKEQGATFDRFGLFCQQQGGHYVEVYLDDLKYMAQPSSAP